MGLEELLLGRLVVPASGYDLKAWLDRQASHLWAAELSQIYPTLARLERAGLLESHPARSRRGPARRVYALTDGGREELRRRLEEPPAAPRERSPWRVRLHLAGQLGDDVLEHLVLTRTAAELAARVRRLEAVVERLEAGPPGHGLERAVASVALAGARAEADALARVRAGRAS